MAGPLPDKHSKILAQKLADKQLALFVGAGLSHQAIAKDGSKRRLPLWEELAKEVAKACQEDIHAHGGNILDLFSAIEHGRSRFTLEEAVRSALDDAEYVPSPAHQALAELPWAAVCTTNYDGLLGRVLNANPVSEEGEYDWLRRPANKLPRLFHVHGTLANPHTLTSEDYRLWQEQHPRAYEHLKDVVLNKTVLFVGYSFSDPHLEYGILPIVRKITESRKERHYAWMWQIPQDHRQLLDRRDKIEAISINIDEEWATAFRQVADALGEVGHPSDGAVSCGGTRLAGGPQSRVADVYTGQTEKHIVKSNGQPVPARRRWRAWKVAVTRWQFFGTAAMFIALLFLGWLGWDRPLWSLLSPSALETRLYGPPPVSPTVQPTIKFYGGRKDDTTATDLDEEISRRFRMDSGVIVDVYNPTPQERFQNVRSALEAHSDGFDVFLIDAPWVQDLAPHLLDLRPYFVESELSAYDQLVIHNNSIGGKLAAMPLFREVGLLFYRDDLLGRYDRKVPQTWQELAETARLIQQGEGNRNPDFIGFAWQGAPYEGLTCNALEWIASRGGIDEKTGQILFDSPAVLEALDQARQWLNSISRGVDKFTERDSLLMFANGQAAFMRIWASAYAGLRKLKLGGISFKVDTLPYEQGNGVSTLGGWQLAVSQYSRNQQLAIEFVRYLASSNVQRWSVSKSGVLTSNENVKHPRRTTIS